MSADSPAVAHYLGEFSSHAGGLPGMQHTWLREAREGALARFANLGFPTLRQEEWKYTQVAAIEKRAFRAAPAGAPVSLAEVEPLCFSELTCHRMVFVDGHYQPGLSTATELPRGVTITSMAEALASPPQALAAHLARHADAGRHAFTALNTAFMRDGAFVHVARRVLVSQPIHLLFLASGRSAEFVAHPRVLVVADVASRATVIESYASLGDAAYFTNALCEVAIGEGACVHHFKFQRESPKAFHVATLQVHTARDSVFHSHSISCGARLARNDINVVLDAPGTECTLDGLFLGSGRQHVDFHTCIDHQKPRGTSIERFKGIVGGHARGVFNGRVRVHADAQHTDAHQSSNNLLLSRDAEIDTKPELEIYADDVKCSHGATVGHLDENMLYYLRTRGIPEAAARGLLIYGFARDVIDRIEVDALRQRMSDALVSYLPNADEVKEVIS